MRWLAALSVGALLPICLAGCRSSSCDKVEAELHARESDVHVLHDQLEQSEFHNQSLLRELSALRGMPGPMGVVEAPSEPYPVRSLVLGRQTGGQPSDAVPADCALRVLVEPRDPEGQAIKAPGTLLVEAQEVTTEGLKRSLSAWQVPPQDLRNSWQNGLITTGYNLVFPWKVWPSTERMRVIARFQMIDGRIFEADKDITIRVLPENLRKTLSSPAPTPAAPAPAVVETAPPPTVIPFMPKPVPAAPEKPAPAPAVVETAPPPTVIPFMPKPVPAAPEKPAPKSTLPAPLPDPPAPPASEGPRLIQGSAGPVGVRLLKPVPMEPEPDE